MTGRIKAKLFGSWMTGAALLCALSGAQVSLAAQQIPQANAVRQSLAQAGQPSAAPAPASVPPKPATRQPNSTPSAVKPPANPSAKATAKPLANTSAKADAKPVANVNASAKAIASATAIPVAAHENVSRRDPFSPLVGGSSVGAGIPDHLPPGKAGLVIATLRLDGIVKNPTGMIAVVSNGQDRTYFLHEGDQLYNGSVGHITMTDVSFHENGKDPFGKPVEREVSKPLNATPGEQQ